MEIVGFVELVEEKWFDEFYDYLKCYKVKLVVKKFKGNVFGRDWMLSDSLLNFVMNIKLKKVVIEFFNVEVKFFSDWFLGWMDCLYDEYKWLKIECNGD